jgi:hypothetical protein
MIGKNRKKQEETEQNRDEKSASILVGFRAVYVFERLSRDLWPRFYPLDRVRDAPQSARR